MPPIAEVPPPSSAPAPEVEVRPWHGSAGFGGDGLATGNGDGSRLRLGGEVDVEPGGALGRFGGSLALRAVDKDHHGIATIGLVYEGAAARPRVVVDLHVDVGVDLDAKAPAMGGGVRTVVGIYGPLGVALDGGAILVVDGIDKSRLVIGGSTELVIKF